MKPTERKLAESLRRQGATYREILQQIPVSKSTLSLWLRGIPLTEAQMARIHGKDMEIRRKFVECNASKHRTAMARHRTWEGEAKAECSPLSAETLKWVGAALYWGEGTKASSKGRIRLSNSDPEMIRLIMRWFREICRVPEHKFRVSVQIHEEQSLDAVEYFWSQVTGIPRSQFTKAAIRVSRSSLRRRGNILPHGTAHVEFCDTQLFHRILGWIRGLSAPSYSGLVRGILNAETRVQFPVGPPFSGSEPSVCRDRLAVSLS